jgi:hypothetical protein
MSLTKVKNVLDITADTVADLANAEHKTGSIQLLGFHTKGDGGGGVFYWDATKDKSEHNGGTIIDPSIAGLVANWEYTQNLYFSPAAIGQGCWVREYSGAVDVKWFGAKGDGVADDTNSIQKTLNTAKTSYIPSGNYNIKGNTLEVDSDKTIYGDGDLSKIISDSSLRDGTPNDEMIRNSDQVNGNSNILIKNLWIFGDRSNSTNQYNGIDFVKCKDIKIHNVTFEDHGTGLWLVGGSDIDVRDCTFLRTIANKAGLVTDLSEKVTRLSIIGCFFNGAENEAIDINGAVEGLLITSNTFFNNHIGNDDSGATGNEEVIDIGDGYTNSITDVVIADNLFSLNSVTKSAIWLKQGTKRATITGNVIRNGKDGAGSTYTNALIMLSRVSNVVVSNNHISEGDCGICVTDDDGHSESEGIIITNNHIQEMRYDGITIDATSARAVNISNNILYGVTATGEGISVTAAKNIRLVSNEVYDFDSDAISVGAGSLYPTITSNTLRNCGGSGVVMNAANFNISENTIISCAGNGVSTNNEDGLIKNCIIESCSTGVVIGANRNQVSGCHIRSNNIGVDIPSGRIDLIILGNYVKGNTTAEINNQGNAGGSSVVVNNITT